MTSTHAPRPSFRNLKEVAQVAPGRHILGVANFTTGSADPSVDEGYPSVAIHMTGSVEDGFAEVWTSDRPVRAGQAGSMSYAHDGEFLFCTGRIPETADYVEATEAAYTEVLALTGSLGYRQLVRIWHYISRLNEETAEGLETYRAFCLGRARVLERYGMTDDMPAATVIGSHGGGIVFYFLASRGGTQINVDNPRQVPPYHYPRRYGVKSPNFARATYVRSDDGATQIYVSGTASILGHRTMNAGDVEGQCRLALDNIAYLIGEGNLSAHGIQPGRTLDDLRTVKVYVRRRSDIERVQRICRTAFSRSADVVFLHADICRHDLLVEIEGIVPGERAVERRSLPGPVATQEWSALPAAQQPDWHAHPAYERVRSTLSAAPPLVSPDELGALRTALAAVAAGSARVLQMGDCAESFYESTPDQVALKIAAMERLAERFAARAGLPVVKIGRLGGQYAKPRSHAVEVVDGVELPAFRGHMVNAETPSAEARRPHPARMLWAYHLSDDVQRLLRTHRNGSAHAAVPPGPWSSHDALVMDYIGPLVRNDPATGARFLASTHFPWVGERTGGIGEAHVLLLSLVSNPVACKVGPRSTPESVLALCALLDPEREPGRLTLIARMGRDAIGTVLPPILRAVRAARHPVVWLSDPMHGNTVRLPSGAKTRYLDDMVAEAATFRNIVEGHGNHVGGLHLETAAYDVAECAGGPAPGDGELGNPSLCDPRLTIAQAAALIDRVF
ncbi:FkbO/Hyg5 family chorismatase [Actinophytocola algeriensis]|uniref:Phospho-2-dehydro-3-deoxyheptonate aldolase n=1 Tax=Actinophytocola algeriensis TaxID=1768010 RepID=A0A7W7QC17_9PSEU|nr:FkbO/Hyg5 family chorismatase [Actinophytocola algeriensis]MBB4910658.1 FkbO/Hyg5 family chorismatase [Actinophytocola algeriensis]MBE1473651.1 FkbO/Hyg5 family chorismatase [Actinophytocola algeriensis]